MHSVSNNAYGCTFKCVRNDMKIPLPKIDESIEDRTAHTEQEEGTFDVLGTAYVGESDEAQDY